MRQKITLDDNWKFHLGDFKTPIPHSKAAMYCHAKTQRALWGPSASAYNDNSNKYSYTECMCVDRWDDISLPHDYIISQEPKEQNNISLGYFSFDNAWYRKHFTLNEDDLGKRITLYFEGVSHHSTVYVNGCLMHHNFCGYTPFEIDITDIANFDKENVIAVYVDTEEQDGWWYAGCGIYRHVWIVKTEMVSVDLWGVYVNPQKQSNSMWSVPVETTVRNDTMNEQTVTVASTIYDENGKAVASSQIDSAIPCKEKSIQKDQLMLENPALWDIDSPHLYSLKTQISQNNVLLDTTDTIFGFRTIRFDCNKGFFLNEKPIKLKGVCCHQDYGLTGKAVPDNIQHYRIKLLKEMGANAYRTAHYPHPEVTMDAMDKIGLMVMDETRRFESTKEGIDQLKTMILRDRNHPCVILWSIGNEEPLHKFEQGKRITNALTAIVNKLDSSRPVTTAISNDPAHAAAVEVSQVIGVNYNLKVHDFIHNNYPEKPFVISECCATPSTRGWYLDDNASRSFLASYDHDAYAFGSTRENTWKHIMEREYISGGFQWAGIEHRGETDWPRLCSQCGALDLFLQKKDAFYQNQSHWVDKPMIHLLPHWNHEGREGEVIPVWAYTNCEEAELFLDDKSLGSQKIEKYGHAAWNVPYQKGTLTVHGIIEGKIAVTDTVETTGKPVKLCLTVETPEVYANGQDTVVLTCFCADEQGRIVPDAAPMISYNSNPLGKIIGTGSDVTDHTPVPSLDRKMRAGLCAVAVKAGKTPGKLIVYANAEGLTPAKIEIELK